MESISCKRCGSRLITTTYSSDYELSKIILNKLKGSEINTEQNHKFERAWKTASLINNFGKKALTVLSGYGIGVETAARILRNYVDDENLYKNIYMQKDSMLQQEDFGMINKYQLKRSLNLAVLF